MGESGVTAPMMKAWMEIYKPLLVGQDPLAIGYHWHRMTTLMHTYMARIPAMSGIDMACGTSPAGFERSGVQAARRAFPGSRCRSSSIPSRATCSTAAR